MKDSFAFLDALQQIARDKGISVDVLLDALANALVAAYKRMPGAAEEAVVTIEADSGEIRVYGQELDEEGAVIREWDDTPKDFGRIAAQTAKQVIFQRIREAERDLKYEEYAGREGDIMSPSRPAYSSYLRSRSASRIRWKITCLAVCAAIRPKSLGVSSHSLMTAPSSSSSWP